MSVATTPDLSNPVNVGRTALAEGRWPDAFNAIRAYAQGSFDLESLELLGVAAWYVDDAEAAFEAFDAAYRVAVESGDRFGQARAALWVVACRTTFKDQTNIATGWLRRVYDGLDRRVLSRELGWMRIRECEMALQAPSAGIKKSYVSARKATEIGRRLDDPDLQVLGLSIEGLTLMAGGRLTEGAERLTAAHDAIANGRFTQHFAAASAYAMIIDAYERVRDYDRMEAWCACSRAFCLRWNLRYPLAICQTQHASALMVRGRWDEAEAELAAAADELATTRPGLLGRAFVRLGELRRRQGRLIEATTLFDRAAGQPATGLCQVALLIDRGNATRAFYVVNRIRRWVLPENRAGRVGVQEVASRASLALPDIVKASEAIDEIQKLAQAIPTAATQAIAAFSRGLMQQATGDLEGAGVAFADAKSRFLAIAMPYDATRASVELAYALAAAGHVVEAIAEAESAADAADRIGATPLSTRATTGAQQWRDGAAAAEAAAASASGAAATAASPRKGGSLFSSKRTVSGIGPARRPAPAAKPAAPTVPAARVAAQALGLSVREYRILKMLADGRTIPEIAQVLRGGEPTIDRDLANMMRKLGTTSRAAAVAAAKERGLV
jgi:LuxR family maltose regulon positive regulatory protein